MLENPARDLIKQLWMRIETKAVTFELQSPIAFVQRLVPLIGWRS